MQAMIWAVAMLASTLVCCGLQQDDQPNAGNPSQGPPAHGQGAAVADVDDDGVLDLVLTNAANIALQDPAQNQNPGQNANLIYELLIGAGEDNGLGVVLTALDPALRAQLNVPEGQGIVVSSLASGGPADQVGLKPNDILLTLGDRPLGEPGDLVKRLKESGEKAVSLALVRNGKRVEIPVKPQYRVTFVPAEPAKPKYYIGVQTAPVDATLRAHLELPAESGLVVNQVVDDSPAAKAGVQSGDIILQFGGTSLPDSEALSARIQAAEGKPSELKILRGGKEQTIQVTPAPRPEQPETAADANYLRARVLGQALQSYPHHRFRATRPEAVWLNSLRSVTGNAAVNLSNPMPSDPSAELAKQVAELRKAVETLKAELEKKGR
jgi:serine protease Do